MNSLVSVFGEGNLHLLSDGPFSKVFGDCNKDPLVSTIVGPNLSLEKIKEENDRIRQAISVYENRDINFYHRSTTGLSEKNALSIIDIAKVAEQRDRDLYEFAKRKLIQNDSMLNLHKETVNLFKNEKHVH